MIEITDEGSGPARVFLHGWPDSPSLWDGLVDALRPTHRCIRVQLPGFPGSQHRHGADFPVLADAIEDQLRQRLDDERVVLIGHDWGAMLTYLLAARHPDRIDRMVTMDVGGHLPLGGIAAIAFVGYQGWLIAAEAIGRFAPAVGDPMARWMARRVHAPHPERTTARMGYVYRFGWRAMLSPRHRISLAHRFIPKHPLLFMYGTRKPFHFHSSWWVEMLEASSDCEVLPVEAEHWLMLRGEAQVLAAITVFIGADDSD